LCSIITPTDAVMLHLVVALIIDSNSRISFGYMEVKGRIGLCRVEEES